MMPLALPLILFVFWMYIAYRAFERGDMMWAGICVVAGIALTVYRIRSATRASRPPDSQKPP
jgi:hypothetical protein